MSMQNDIERLQDKIEIGALDAGTANVELVKIQRFKIVKNGLPRQVRKDLNAAVKGGELGHYKKDGYKPEAYFHPDFAYMAKAERIAIESNIKNAAATVLSVDRLK